MLHVRKGDVLNINTTSTKHLSSSKSSDSDILSIPIPKNTANSALLPENDVNQKNSTDQNYDKVYIIYIFITYTHRKYFI